MKPLWNRFVAWFDLRIQRERAILGVAVIGGILMLGFDQWVWPNFTKARTLSRDSAQQVLSMAEAKNQIALLQKQVADPDAKARLALEDLHKKLAAQEPHIRGAEAAMVPASKMAQFLQNLLARGHSLKLISLKTLPPQPLVTPAQPAGVAPTGPAPPASASSAGVNLFKHGVTLKISGSYADLLAYLRDLEAAPQKVIWGRLELNAGEYPTSTIELTVYTLSLDQAWLVI